MVETTVIKDVGIFSRHRFQQLLRDIERSGIHVVYSEDGGIYDPRFTITLRHKDVRRVNAAIVLIQNFK